MQVQQYERHELLIWNGDGSAAPRADNGPPVQQRTKLGLDVSAKCHFIGRSPEVQVCA